MLDILIGCEFSGIVRDAFIAMGHNAVSCDLIETEIIGPHYKGNIFDILYSEHWDILIAFPPCTHLAVSGAAWFKEKRKDGRQKQAIDFFMKLVNAPVFHKCIENPVGIMSSKYRKPDQKIQPWQFGDSRQKTTCLWLYNLPKLESTLLVDKGEFIITKSGKKMPKWYSDCFRLNKTDREKERSRISSGIAEAMALQWSMIDYYHNLQSLT